MIKLETSVEVKIKQKRKNNLIKKMWKTKKTQIQKLNECKRKIELRTINECVVYCFNFAAIFNHAFSEHNKIKTD